MHTCRANQKQSKQRNYTLRSTTFCAYDDEFMRLLIAEFGVFSFQHILIY